MLVCACVHANACVYGYYNIRYVDTCNCKSLFFSEDMKAVLDQCRSSLKKATGVLHGNNIYLTRLLDYAMDAAIDKEEFELALKYGKKTLDTYK